MSTSEMDGASLRSLVAIVTGGGRGLGRTHALALAAQGATVVVNDVGAGIDGGGRDDSVASSVVSEIEQAGGVARADSRSIASFAAGEALVRDTIEWFGHVDIVVNNAGFAHGGGAICELDMLGMEALLDVHLRAALGTMNASFPHMLGRKYGRIINTVSEASLDSRFVGGIGYGTAKAAVWGATLAVAKAAEGTGVTVNAISPGARTRLSGGALDSGFRDGASTGLDLAPEHVSRVVAYLAGPDAADINGRIIHAASGVVREYSTRRSADTPLVARLGAFLSQHGS